MKNILRKLFCPLVVWDIRTIIREIGDVRYQVRETPKTQLIKFHRGLGMSLRNNFRGGRFRSLFADSSRVVHDRGEPLSFDAVSLVAMEQIWEELQKDKYAGATSSQFP